MGTTWTYFWKGNGWYHMWRPRNQVWVTCIQGPSSTIIGDQDKHNTITGDSIKQDGCDYTLPEATSKVSGSFGWWHCKTTSEICTYMQTQWPRRQSKGSWSPIQQSGAGRANHGHITAWWSRSGWHNIWLTNLALRFLTPNLLHNWLTYR